MKIAFWSNTYEQALVSYNLAAVSIACVMRYPYSVSVMENHLHKDNLGLAFLGTSRVPFIREIGTNYYEGGGVEGLLRSVYRGSANPPMLRTYINEVIPKHLYYIPQSRYIHNELFDYELNDNLAPLFNLLEETNDICFIDTAPLNLNSKAILETADLIVVNLCQNQNFLEDFFMNYSSLIPKSVFIIGNYTTQTFLNIRRISNLYELPLENITPIPWNEAFQSASLRGRAVEFVTGNYKCLRENPNYLFIQAIRKAAGMIIKRAELSGELSRKELIHCGK
jgi:hypothetical protein